MPALKNRQGYAWDIPPPRRKNSKNDTDRRRRFAANGLNLNCCCILQIIAGIILTILFATAVLVPFLIVSMQKDNNNQPISTTVTITTVTTITITTATTTTTTSPTSTTATTTSTASTTATTTVTTTSITTSTVTTLNVSTTSTTAASASNVTAATTTATTTVTTKTTSATVTTIATTSTTSTTTVTVTTTTTTTLPTCGSSTCGTDTSVYTEPFIARWNFENSYVDSMLTYPGTPINGPTFVQGYVGKALSLDLSSNQYVSTAFIPLTSKSFTIDAWVYLTSYSSATGVLSIVGLCPVQGTNQCLQFGFRYNSTMTSCTSFIDFWEVPDLHGFAIYPLNTWTHIAVTYATASPKRLSLYFNGVYDYSRKPSNGFTGSSGTFYIGNNYALTSNPAFGANTFHGYIDQLSITNGTRSSCEILNIATMAARFSFDNSSNILADYGPNGVSVTGSLYAAASGLQGTQGISFSTSLSSYIQASGFRFYSYDNSPFSISLWVQPTVLQGTLVGSSLGYSPLTFASNGYLVGQMGSTSITYSSLLELTPIWTNIVLTWSLSNGLKLYVNNQLVSSATTSTFTGTAAVANSLTLGGGSFAGTFDEWRIYSRELTVNEVCSMFLD